MVSRELLEIKDKLEHLVLRVKVVLKVHLARRVAKENRFDKNIYLTTILGNFRPYTKNKLVCFIIIAT